MTYDFSHVAATYALLTAGLAGFAFVALIFVLTSAHQSNGTSANALDAREADAADAAVTGHVVVALMCAFLGLVVCTLLYSVLSGETCAALLGGRANSEELLAGIAFGFSAMTLLYVVALIIERSPIRQGLLPVRVTTAVVVPTLVTLFVTVAAPDIAYRAKIEQPSHANETFYTVTTWLPLSALVVFAFTSWVYLHGRRRGRPRLSLDRVGNYVPVLSLAASIAAAVFSDLIPSTQPGWRLHPWAVYFGLAVTALLVTAQGALLGVVFGTSHPAGPQQGSLVRRWVKAISSLKTPRSAA